MEFSAIRWDGHWFKSYPGSLWRKTWLRNTEGWKRLAGRRSDWTSRTQDTSMQSTAFDLKFIWCPISQTVSYGTSGHCSELMGHHGTFPDILAACKTYSNKTVGLLWKNYCDITCTMTRVSLGTACLTHFFDLISPPSHFQLWVLKGYIQAWILAQFYLVKYVLSLVFHLQ